MRTKNLSFLTAIAVIMMLVGCPNDPQNGTIDSNNLTTEQTQEEKNKAASGLEKNLTIIGKIQDTTCDITLNASNGMFTAAQSRSSALYSGEFFYYNGKLQLKVTSATEIFCLTAKVSDENFKANDTVVFESNTVTAYEIAKTEFKQANTTTTSTTIQSGNQTFSLTETKYISDEVTLSMGGESSTDMKMGGSVRFTTDNRGKLSFLMNGNPIMQWNFTYTVDDFNTIVFSLSEQETPMGEITSGTLTGILNDDKTSISLSGEFNINNGTESSSMVYSIIGTFEKSDDTSVDFDPVASFSETIFNLAATEFRAVNAEMLYHDTTHDRTNDYPAPILFLNDTSGYCSGGGWYNWFTYKEDAENNQIICTMSNYQNCNGNGTFIINISEDYNTIEILPSELSSYGARFSLYGTFKRFQIPFHLGGRTYKTTSIIYDNQNVTQTSEMTIKITNGAQVDLNTYTLTSLGDIGSFTTEKLYSFYWKESDFECRTV